MRKREDSDIAQLCLVLYLTTIRDVVDAAAWDTRFSAPRRYHGTRVRTSGFDDTRLIGADNLYAALIRRYFQVALRRRSYAERARDGVRRVECNLAG